MEGTALHLTCWVLRRTPTVTWAQFTGELLQRFDENPLYDPFETLMETVQKGFVDDCVNGFVARMEHVSGLTDAHLHNILL